MEQPKPQAIMDGVISEMRTAIESLEKAEPAPPLLGEALPPEQKAYAGLLKLAAHEYEISRMRGQGGGESRGGAKQESSISSS